MEKLYSIMVFKTKDVAEPVMMASAVDVSSFSILQRSGAEQFITFVSRTVSGKTKPDTRQQVVEQEYRVYVHARGDGIACVVCANQAYPDRVAFALCSSTMSEFSETFAGKFEGNKTVTENQFAWPDLKKKLKKFQNPKEADQILKIQKDLEEIQTLMLQNMDKVLERGDNITTLVERSTDLSSTSKQFYKTARKTNQGCCLLM